MTQKEDEAFRLSKYTSHFLETFSRMYRLREPDEEMISLYTNKFHGVDISHLVNSFEICYEQFKDSQRYPSPEEILVHVADEKRLIGNQKSGPLEIYEGNREMLQIFIKAFRESPLKGETLENHLNGIVERNYGRLCGERVPNCKICKDRGYVRGWFVYYPGTKNVFQKCADGKTRSYFEHNRVPNSPVWVQEEEPGFQPPPGQGLSDGIFRCDCEGRGRMSLPRMFTNGVPA